MTAPTTTPSARPPETHYRELTLRVDHEALAKRAAAARARAASDGNGQADAGDAGAAGDAGDAADDRIPVALSSEAAVLRYDWWEGESYYELLDHGPDAVDLSYARDGMPFLLEHTRAEQHGIVEDLTIDGDRVLRGMLRMSKAPRSQEIRQDILDGIRKKVSVGYRLSDDYDQTAGEGGAPPTRRYRNWTPMELSAVSIPADYSVGYHRGADGAALPEPVRAALQVLRDHTNPAAPVAKEQPVSTTTTAAQQNGAGGNNGGAGGAPDVRVQATTEERARVQQITEICTEHAIEGKKTTEWIGSGASVAEVQRQVLAIVKERMAKPTKQGPVLELSAKERKRYSYARAILALAAQYRDSGITKVDAGFEEEVSEEIGRRLPPEYNRRGGILIPTQLERRDLDSLEVRAGLDSATATKGQELKFTQPGDFIDVLRNAMVTRALGARVLSGLTGPVSFPKKTAGASGSWVAENPGADVADQNLLLALVTLAIKTYQSSTSFSRQLLVSALSASVDAEQMVREDLAIDVALAFDKAGIQGPGTGNQPRGILNTAGIGSVAIGANGGAPTNDTIVDLETACADANAQIGACAYLTTPVMRGKLKKTQQFANTNGMPIWTGGRQGEMNGYPAEVSNQVPKTLTKGTSVDCHAIIHGCWNQLIYGEWGALELIIDPLRLKKQGMIEVTTFFMGDVALRQPASFAACQDARNV